MITKNRLPFLVVCIIFLIAGCGPSEEERQQQEQARQDSIEQARQDSLQQIRQQRQDSLRQARADSAEQNDESSANINFSENGAFSVQVASWRSQQKAQQQANMWKERGFDQAYVVEHGTESTGDIWYRVRLGRLQNRAEAQKLIDNVQQEYQAQAWIASGN